MTTTDTRESQAAPDVRRADRGTAPGRHPSAESSHGPGAPADLARDLAAGDAAFAACLTEAVKADMERTCDCGTTGYTVHQRARQSQNALLALLAPTDPRDQTSGVPEEPPSDLGDGGSAPGPQYGEFLAAGFRATARELQDLVEAGVDLGHRGAVAAHIATIQQLAAQLTHLLGLEP